MPEGDLYANHHLPRRGITAESQWRFAMCFLIVAERHISWNKYRDIVLRRQACTPAVALAAGGKTSQRRTTRVLVLAADHVVPTRDAFRAAAFMPYAEAGKLVFGVPDLQEPDVTIFVAVMSRVSRTVAFEVAQFVEKPNLETAQAYVASGRYYWNGNVLFDMNYRRTEKYLECIVACEKAIKQSIGSRFYSMKGVSRLSEESVDYANGTHGRSL